MRTNQDPPDMQKLMQDKKALAQLASSQEARALAGMLTQGRKQEDLRQIARDAARGDTRQLGDLARSIAGSPAGAELLRRLSESIGES